MSKPIPPISKFMTTTPHSVGQEQSLLTAREMMRKHGIRHLPVLHGGRLRGVVTDRDVSLIESMTGFDSTKLTVEEAMTVDVHSVPPDAPLDEVATHMAEHKHGCVVVMDHANVVGIFTTTDACRALAELLHTRLAK